MKRNIAKEKSFDFALEIIKSWKHLSEEKKEYTLSKQLLRSGTAIGALITESERAESKADFIHKLSISLKEASETEYWIALLHQSGIMNVEMHNKLNSEVDQLIRLLVSIIKKTRETQALLKSRS